MTDLVIVLVTAPDLDIGAQLARAVVEERLAACGNLIPGVRSIYRWQGQVHDDAEVLLVLKTSHDAVERLRARVVALHPYDCPEVVALPVSAVHPPYLAWVLGQVERQEP